MKWFTCLAALSALALGLVACGKGNSLTAPNGGTYLEIVDGGITIRATYPCLGWWGGPTTCNSGGGEGAEYPTQTVLTVLVTLHGRGETEVKEPVTATVVFRFEDGTSYENHALAFGPFTGFRFDIKTTLRLQDGLAQAAAGKTGQRIVYVLKLSNGQEFNIFGFYLGR